MFEGEHCDLALLKLDECGLLEEIFPIYKEVKRVVKTKKEFIEEIKNVSGIGDLVYEKIKNYLPTKAILTYFSYSLQL